MVRALKTTFFEARKACLRIARRLTLCPDSHRDRRVSCSIPSRAAGRGEDCFPFKPRLVPKGCFSKQNGTRSSWRRAHSRVTFAWRTCRFGRSPTTNRQHRIILRSTHFLKLVREPKTDVSDSFSVLYESHYAGMCKRKKALSQAPFRGL